MHKSLLKSAVCGGVVAFVWLLISWSILPIHKQCFHRFHNEDRVASVIRDNAPEKGMYVLPYTFDYDENSSQDEMKRAIQMMDTGPFMFAAVLPDGNTHGKGRAYIFSLVTQVIGAFLASWLLSQAGGLAFRQKVLFVALFGLGVGILTYLPAWNWLGFSGAFVITQIFDLIVAWTLAGYTIAKVLKSGK